MEEIKFFSTLGVGGVLAGFMFWAYRIDRHRTEQAMAKLVEQMATMNCELIEVIKENTKAVTELVTTVRNGSAQSSQKTASR